MTGRCIAFSLAIEASPAAIWAALTQPEQIAQWSYPETVEVDKIEPGGVYGFLTEDAGDEDGAEILEMDSPTRLKMRWYSSEPAPTTLEWLLEPREGYTVLHFVNAGFHDTAEWNTAYTQDFEGWVALHLALKALLESRGGSAS